MNTEARALIEKEVRKCEVRAERERAQIEQHLDCILRHREKIVSLENKKGELIRALKGGEPEGGTMAEAMTGENGKSEMPDGISPVTAEDLEGAPQFLKDLLLGGKGRAFKMDLSGG